MKVVDSKLEVIFTIGINLGDRLTLNSFNSTKEKTEFLIQKGFFVCSLTNS